MTKPFQTRRGLTLDRMDRIMFSKHHKHDFFDCAFKVIALAPAFIVDLVDAGPRLIKRVMERRLRAHLSGVIGGFATRHIRNVQLNHLI